MEEKTRAVVLGLTAIRKLPSFPVTTPELEPFGRTVTPWRGDPSRASDTFPETVLFCACAAEHMNSRNKRALIPASNRFFIIVSFWLKHTTGIALAIGNTGCIHYGLCSLIPAQGKWKARFRLVQTFIFLVLMDYPAAAPNFTGENPRVVDKFGTCLS